MRFFTSMILLLSSHIANAELPKQKLLVIHSSYCGHCQKWIDEVAKSFEDQAKAHGIKSVPDLKLYDVTETEGQNLVETMTKEKVLTKPVNAVPAFIILDENGNEKTNCRMAGYSSKTEWFNNAKAMIERCTKSTN